MSIFEGAPDTKVLAFAVSHLRNDVQLPVDLVIELSERGFQPVDLAISAELVDYVEEFDAYYETFLADDSEFQAQYGSEAVGGTD